MAIIFVTTVISSCSFDDEVNDAEVPEPITDLASTYITIGETCDESAQSQQISFAHLADLHANFALQDRKFEKLKYFYQTIKEQNPYTIFTNAGDDYEKGSVAEALSYGTAVKDAIFAMEFDIRTLGNHDFAWGTTQLLEYVRDPHAKVLASNTKYIGDGDTFDAYDFVQAQVGCVKVGFFGMVSLPWNELDETYDGNFLAEVTNDFSYYDISQDVISNFRSQVDILVLISHLGIVEDQYLADSISGIDLILGGHSHSGVIEETIGDALVIQPEFFADGISQVDIEYDLVNEQITSISHQAYYTSDMQLYDTELAQSLDSIADSYAEGRHDIIAYAELTSDTASVADISLNAIYDIVETDLEIGEAETAKFDAVLLNPNLVWTAWEEGGVSKQIFYDAYNVERQKSDTPGFNSIYKATITGANIQKMLTQQPLWLYKGIEDLEDSTEYTLALNKGPAINISAFFTDVEYVSDPEFVDENWQILTDYGVKRMEQCLYVDTDNSVVSCIDTEYVLFDFNSVTTPLDAAEGTGEMSAFDPSNDDWFVASEYIKTPDEFAITKANDLMGNIFKFDAFDEDQGMKVTHNLSPNGYLKTTNKLSYYSLIFDLYIPSNSDEWSAILQTNLLNTDDAELFVHQDEETGLEIGGVRYFSGITFNTWHRVAIVVNSNEVEGETNVYVDGSLVGTITHEDERWTIESSLLMFTDNTPETSNGFIDNILFVNKPLTELEIEEFGDASQVISTSLLPVGTNE